MLQKEALDQDMFLIGPPGPERLRLALALCNILVSRWTLSEPAAANRGKPPHPLSPFTGAGG
jgi:hypothetical protein